MCTGTCIASILVPAMRLENRVFSVLRTYEPGILYLCTGTVCTILYCIVLVCLCMYSAPPVFLNGPLMRARSFDGPLNATAQWCRLDLHERDRARLPCVPR